MLNIYSGVGEFEGSGGGPGEFVISGCLAPTPTPVRKKSHRIFTFCTDPTGQLRGEGVRGRGSGLLDPLLPASYEYATVYTNMLSELDVAYAGLFEVLHEPSDYLPPPGGIVLRCVCLFVCLFVRSLRSL